MTAPDLSPPSFHPTHPADNAADAEHGGKLGGGTSWLTTASLIVANMLGAGVLGLPYAVKVSNDANPHAIARSREKGGQGCRPVDRTEHRRGRGGPQRTQEHQTDPLRLFLPSSSHALWQSMGWLGSAILLVTAALMSVYGGVLLGKLRGSRRKIKVS